MAPLDQRQLSKAHHNRRRTVNNTLLQQLRCYEKKSRRVLNGPTMSNPCIRLCIRKSSSSFGLQIASFWVWQLCNERKRFLWGGTRTSTTENSNLVIVGHGRLAVLCKEKSSACTVFYVLHFCNAAFYSFGGVRGRHKSSFDAPKERIARSGRCLRGNRSVLCIDPIVHWQNLHEWKGKTWIYPKGAYCNLELIFGMFLRHRVSA